MMEKLFRLPGMQIKLNESQGADPVPEWIQLARVGTFYDPRYKTFEITPAHLLSMKKNFDSGTRGIDIAIDYKHDSEDVAAGWVKEVETRENNTQLWGRVDWTPNGQKKLAEKEFRYISPEFHFDYQDNETLKKHGPTLLGAGLTNRPVIKRMSPAVELTESKGEEMKTVEELTAEVTKLSEDLNKAQEQNKAMSDALGGASPEDLKKQIDELKTQHDALKTENESLKASAQKSEEAAKLAEKEKQFTKLLSEGKLVAAQKDAFIAGDAVKLAELAQPVKLSEGGTGAEPPKSTTPATRADAETEIQKLAQVKLSEKKASSMGDAIRMVLSENETLRKVYQGN